MRIAGSCSEPDWSSLAYQKIISTCPFLKKGRFLKACRNTLIPLPNNFIIINSCLTAVGGGVNYSSFIRLIRAGINRKNKFLIFVSLNTISIFSALEHCLEAGSCHYPNQSSPDQISFRIVD